MKGGGAIRNTKCSRPNERRGVKRTRSSLHNRCRLPVAPVVSKIVAIWASNWSPIPSNVIVGVFRGGQLQLCRGTPRQSAGKLPEFLFDVYRNVWEPAVIGW